MKGEFRLRSPTRDVLLAPEPVLKCLTALEAAENDTEKLAALFLVPKLVKGADCDKNARLCLMKVGTLMHSIL